MTKNKKWDTDLGSYRREREEEDRNIKYDSDRRWWNGKTADVTDPTKNAQEMLTQGMCLYRDKE